jgi:hypothetical protein
MHNFLGPSDPKLTHSIPRRPTILSAANRREKSLAAHVGWGVIFRLIRPVLPASSCPLRPESGPEAGATGKRHETPRSLISRTAAACYRQGISDLVGADRVSYRGTAAELRESLRETLDHLAPDAEVEQQRWYKPEDRQTRPTMKRKARYILTSRGRNRTQMTSAEKLLGLIEELSGEVMRAVYNRASLATHVHQSKNEVRQIKRYVDTVLFDLLEIAQ